MSKKRYSHKAKPGDHKRGRWSKAEVATMREQAGKTPVETIAQQLNRDVETVKLWISENMAIDVSEGAPVPIVETEIRNELRDSLEWQELKDQFVSSELKMFEHKYSKLVSQFKGDVLPTESTQIFMLIKLEILMSRNLKGRQRALQDIQRIEIDIEDLLSNFPAKKDMPDADKDRLRDLDNQLLAAREAEGSKTAEYIKLSEKHSAAMKDLKATRDQRISRAENAKESWIGLIKSLQEEEVREREGQDLSLMELAVEKEKGRLSKSHKYVDDSYDQPLLTPDTVGGN